MKNYKIILQYDGTRYKGWQVQNSTDMTIQGKLQMVLEEMCGHPVEVIGSGRTDAGVHALGQVANFHNREGFTPKEIQDYLNGMTLQKEGEKGWHLVCVDGISIGWGKLAGQILKNHYPKGLRIMR